MNGVPIQIRGYQHMYRERDGYRLEGITICIERGVVTSLRVCLDVKSMSDRP